MKCVSFEISEVIKLDKAEAIEILMQLEPSFQSGYSQAKMREAINMATTALKIMGCGCGLCLTHNGMKCPRESELKGE